MEETKKQIKVFITYRQENDNYKRDVIAFTDFLRQKGFHAEMDELVRQEETSIDFPKMMHKIFTDYSSFPWLQRKSRKICWWSWSRIWIANKRF